MDDESVIPPNPKPFHRFARALNQKLQHYQGGQWTDIPVESITIQARGPDGPIELTIEMLETLLREYRAPRTVRIQIAPTVVQIDGKTIVEMTWPEIERRIDDDLSDDLAGIGIVLPPGGKPPDAASADLDTGYTPADHSADDADLLADSGQG